MEFQIEKTEVREYWRIDSSDKKGVAIIQFKDGEFYQCDFSTRKNYYSREDWRLLAFIERCISHIESKKAENNSDVIKQTGIDDRMNRYEKMLSRAARQLQILTGVVERTSGQDRIRGYPTAGEWKKIVEDNNSGMKACASIEVGDPT